MFNMNAKEYNDNVMQRHFRKVYPLIAQQILERTGVHQGHCIDLGGGPGMLGVNLAKITSLYVTIYDLLPECIKIALENIDENNLSSRMSAMQGCAEDMSFDDNSIDLVVSRGSIYFWEDQKKALCEVYRILKPRGWAYIGGGMGSMELLAEVIEMRKNDPAPSAMGKPGFNKQPPEHFQTLLEELEIPGAIEFSPAGTWIIFQKPFPI